MGNQILNKFGKKVRDLRSKRGWSQEELANRAKLHRTYIGSIENGKRNISLINIERIAKALGVSLKEMIE